MTMSRGRRELVKWRREERVESGVEAVLKSDVGIGEQRESDIQVYWR